MISDASGNTPRRSRYARGESRERRGGVIFKFPKKGKT